MPAQLPVLVSNTNTGTSIGNCGDRKHSIRIRALWTGQRIEHTSTLPPTEQVSDDGGKTCCQGMWESEHPGPWMPSQGVLSGRRLQGGPLKASEEWADPIMFLLALLRAMSLPEEITTCSDNGVNSIPKRWRRPSLPLWSTLHMGAQNLVFVQISLGLQCQVLN